MATNYVQDGNTLDFHNISGEEIASGQVVSVGELCGIAHDKIPTELWGLLHMTGVFSIPKAPESLTTGQKVFLNDEGLITATADELPLVGTVWADAEADGENAFVRLGF